MMLFLRFFAGFIIQVFPFSLLCMYPFLDYCKYSNRQTLIRLIMLISALACFFSAACIAIKKYEFVIGKNQYYTANILFLILLIPCLFFYIHLTIGNFEMKLFVFLFAVTAANVMTSLCNIVITYVLVPRQTDNLPYGTTSNLVLLLSSFIVLPPLLLLLKKMFLPARNFLQKKEYLQLNILALLLLLILLAGFFPLTEPRWFSHALLFLYAALIFCIFTVYYIFFRIFAIEMKRYESELLLAHSRQQIKAQNEYYQHIIEKTEENRRLRHDFRQHLIVIQGLAAKKNYDQLIEYLSVHLKNMDDLIIPKYSNHLIINILLHHYHMICIKEDIDLQISIASLPKLPISDSDLSTLFGNLLENALDGARSTKKSDKYIHIHMNVQGNQFIITVDNSFDGVTNKSQNTYLSTKKDHMGYGLLSIGQICKKYDGTSTFSHEGTVFFASAVIAIS